MDKLAQYQELVQVVMMRYAESDRVQEGVETQLVMDTVRDHYQWWHVGWRGFERIYHCIIHLDIKEGKIWLQENLTEHNPAEELVEMGVPREDIVLGLQPPYKRPYTDYGVA